MALSCNQRSIFSSSEVNGMFIVTSKKVFACSLSFWRLRTDTALLINKQIGFDVSNSSFPLCFVFLHPGFFRFVQWKNSFCCLNIPKGLQSKQIWNIRSVIFNEKRSGLHFKNKKYLNN